MKYIHAFAFLLISMGIAFAAQAEPLAKGVFQEKEKSLSGNWEIHEGDGRLILELSENFKARKGPDLKIAFSPLPFAKANGNNALDGGIVIAELSSAKGGQSYELPSGFDLSKYKSLLIHCEKYAVLWGGSPLK